MKQILGVILCLIIGQELQAQVLLKEDFEPRTGYNAGDLPPGWTQSYEKGMKDWFYQTGGHDGNPETAAQGNYNAAFYVASLENEKTKLVTPSMNLKSITAPRLRFKHVQQAWPFGGIPYVDELRIWYKTSAKGTWKAVTGGTFTSAVDTWTQREILLDPTDVSTTYYIAFEGKTGYGHGTCIDDIVIEESGTTPRSVASISAVQAATNAIASGTTNNPIIRIDINAIGNTGTLALKNIKINSLNTNDADVTGVKLFTTTTDIFSDQSQLGSTTTFSSGIASFSGLSLDLPFGTRYIWVTYNISSSVAQGHVFDAYIAANQITVNSLTYPASNLSPDGSRNIVETLYSDGFETTTGWTLNGFQIATPTGLGGTGGGLPDPATAANGTKVLGTGFSSTKAVDCDYAGSLTNRQWYAISPKISCKYFKNTTIRFDRWLNLELWDNAYIDIKVSGDSVWRQIWASDERYFIDSRWTNQEIDISQYADRKDTLQVRFSLGPTSPAYNYSGWNIDNFSLTGKFISNDMTVKAITAPISGCGHTATDTVVAQFLNLAGKPTPTKIPVAFSVDGGVTYISDTIFGSLGVGKDTVFKFHKLANLSLPGTIQPIVKTKLPNDDDPKNDSLIAASVQIIPTYTFPYINDFETNNGYWYVDATSLGSWQWGKPSSTNIKTAGSGLRVWKTNLTGIHPYNDSSFVVSPCFNIKSIEIPVVEMLTNTDMLDTIAGATLQYTLNNGATWTTVPKIDSLLSLWKWYNTDKSQVLNQKLGSSLGWTDTIYGWQQMRHFLPQTIREKTRVQFRIAFVSKLGVSRDGFAFDKFRLYEAPIDIGVTSIVSPLDACELSAKEKISVKIKNHGLNTIKAGTTLTFGYIFNGKTTIKENYIVTSDILPKASIPYTFTQTIDLSHAGTYSLKTFTCTPADINFYGKNNDTVTKNIRVYGMPDYDLGPTFGSELNPSVTLDAQPGYVSYLWDDASTNQTRTITAAGTYKVTVKNSEGCYADDSITVFYSAKDLSVVQINKLASACSFTNTVAPEVIVKNIHLEKFPISSKIVVAYTVNNNLPVYDTIVLNKELKSGDSLTYIFTKPIDFSAVDSYKCKFYTVLDDDILHSNDTAKITVENYGYPSIDLGADTVYVKNPQSKTLSAPAGFASYKWQDNSANASLTITSNESKKYSVTVTDIHGCGSASDYVQFITNDFAADSLLSPHTSCAYSKTETVTFRLTNKGTDIFPKNHPVKIWYSINNETPVSETHNLANALSPGASEIVSFSTKADFSKIGNYNIRVAATLDLDIYQENDSLDEDFSVYGYPIVNIGKDTIKTTAYSSVVFDATWPNATYSWNTDVTNTTSSLRVVDPISQWYVVTVTANGCQTKDSSMLWNKDLTIKSVALKAGYCELSNQQKIGVYVKNLSYELYPKGTKFTLGIRIDGGAENTEEFTLTDDLSASDSTIINFTNTFDLSAIKKHTISAYIVKADDVNSKNDTIEAQTEVFGYPKPNLRYDTLYTNTPKTTQLQVEKSFDKYWWKDAKNSTSYKTGSYIYGLPDVLPGWYFVKVESGAGCLGYDSVFVNTKNIEILEPLSPTPSCEGKESDTICVLLKNIFEPIAANDTILLRRQLDGGTIFTDTLVLKNKLDKNAEIRYTFKEKISTVTKKQYSLDVWFNYSKDVDLTNNKKTVTFATFDKPTVDLGVDTIRTNHPELVVLDVLKKNSSDSYAWSFGTATNNEVPTTLVDSVTRKYYITLTDSHDCKAQDSVYVITQDLAIDTLLKPQSACAFSATDTVRVRFTNSGVTEIGTNKKITARYSTDGIDVTTETFYLPVPLAIGKSFDYTFIKTVDLSKISTATITTSITLDDEVEKLNNMKIKKLERFETPQVAFSSDSLFSITPENVVLDAGSGFVSYKWNTGETNQTLQLNTTSAGWYIVTVSNTKGCVASDSICIVNRDLGISSLHSPKSNCTLTENELIQFMLRNTGKLKYNAGTKIAVAVELNNTQVAIDTISITSDLQQNDSILITLKPSLNLKEKQNQQLSIKLIVDKDASISNNSVAANINAWGHPSIAFAQDTIYNSRPDTLHLTVATGYDTYKWTNGLTGNSIVPNVKKSQWWKVTVSDVHSCSSTDSVFLLNQDLAVTALVSPQTSCIFTDNELVSIEVTNQGGDPIPAGSAIPVTVSVDNTLAFKDTLHTLTDLAAGASVVLQSKGLNLKGYNTATIKTAIIWAKDVMTANNILDKSINASGKPNVGFAFDSITTAQPDTVVLRANKGFTYTWSPALSTADTLKVTTKSTWYKLTVTDSKNCLSSDSVYVLTYDLSVANILPNSACSLSSAEKIQTTIINSGGETIAAGSKIPVEYSVNAQSVIDTVILSASLTPKGSVLFTSKKSFDLSKTGNYTISSKLIVTQQQISKANDSLKQTVSAWGTPISSLSVHRIETTRPDTLKIALPTGYASYKWSDGSTNDTLFVSSHLSKWYFVTIDNGHGCTVKDSVLIVSSELALDKLVSPNSKCILSNSETLTIRIKNYGSDTIFAGSKLPIIWKMNSGTVNKESITLASKLSPGDSIDWTSPLKLDMQTIGSYQLSAALYRQIGTEILQTDTQSVSVKHLGLPSLSLANGVDTMRTTLPYNLVAASGFDKYSWNTKTTNDTLVVKQSGKYSVTATTNNGCSATDDIIVWAHDVAIDQMRFPQSTNCLSGMQNKIILTVKNNGKDTLPAGSTLKYKYSLSWVETLNDILYPIVYDTVMTIKLTKAWLPDSTVSLSSGNISGWNQVRTYQINMTVTWPADIAKANNSIKYRFTVKANPKLQLYNGKTSITLDANQKLEAPSGFVSYLWSNGETEQTITITNSGTYSVTATDAAGCKASDEIAVVYTDISDMEATVFQVYPIPTVSQVMVKGKNIKEIVIFDGKGKAVSNNLINSKDEAEVQLSLETLSAGFYYLQIHTDKGIIYRIVQKM